MARKPVPSVRWRVPTAPPVAEIVDAAFSAAELPDAPPLLHKALNTARTGVISAALRAWKCKIKRQTKVKLAIVSKFNSLRRRIDKYHLADDDSISLRLELLEADIVEKLLSEMEK
jgi:hypothetical protein